MNSRSPAASLKITAKCFASSEGQRRPQWRSLPLTVDGYRIARPLSHA